VKVTPEEYEKYGGRHGAIHVSPDSLSTEVQYPYVSRSEKQFIRQKDPHVYRRIGTIYRRTDGEILGTLVTYSRSGGNFAFFSAPGYSCLDLGIKGDVENQIFIVPGEK
jgi:hypothetical protein